MPKIVSIVASFAVVTMGVLFLSMFAVFFVQLLMDRSPSCDRLTENCQTPSY